MIAIYFLRGWKDPGGKAEVTKERKIREKERFPPPLVVFKMDPNGGEDRVRK